MTEYYFDIEMNSTGLRPDVEKDEILTIQFQRISTETGCPLGQLRILKSWESSEQEILEEFYSIYIDSDNPDNPFNFIPIGDGLDFDLFVLHNRWKNYGINVPLKTLFRDNPRLDIKIILVMLNGGRFRDAKMTKFCGKKWEGKEVPKWFAMKDYASIENYIVDESKAFLQFYQKLKIEVPKMSLNEPINAT